MTGARSQLMMLIVLGVAAFLVLFSGGSYTKPYGSVGGQIALADRARHVPRRRSCGSASWPGPEPPSRFLPHTGQRMDEVELRIVASLTGG